MKSTPPKKGTRTGRQVRLKSQPDPSAADGIRRAGKKRSTSPAFKDLELLYRSLFDNMLNGVAYCRMIFEQGRPQDFIYLEVNGAFASLTGLRDVNGKKVSEVIPGIRELDPALFEIYGRVALSGKSEQFETYVEALKMWFTVSVFSPRKEYFVAVFDVITARKQAEEALKQTSGFLRQVVDTSPSMIFVVNAEGRVLFANQYAADYYGTTPEQLLLKLTHDVHVDKAEVGEFVSDDLEVIRTGKKIVKEELNTSPDGKKHLFYTIKVPLQNPDGTTAALGISTDITERKLAEMALYETEARFHSLSEAAFEGIMIHERGVILAVNDAFASMVGFEDAQALVGRNGLEVLPFAASSRELIAKNILSGDTAILEIELIRPDGSMLPVETQGRDLVYQGRKARVVAMRDISKSKLAEQKIGRQLKELAALREIDRVIASSFDLRYNLKWILDVVTRELVVDAADVLILNPVTSQLDYGGTVGFRTRAGENSLMRPAHSHAMRALLDRQVIHIPDLRDKPNDLRSAQVLADEDFVCYFGVPLLAKGSVKGVLEVFHRASLEPDQDWLDFLNTIAGQAALAIDNAILFENLQRSNMDLTLAYDATIEGWSRAMDLRDKETEGHTLRVTSLALELAGLFGFTDEDLVGIRRGALLHDIGKMGVPDGILLKPDKLTEEEWLVMKKHPSLAFEMISPIRYLQSAIDIPYCHHEKWDGTGYPRGLKGELIPLAARIFSVVDVWDALTSDRPYRSAWSNEKVLEYLSSEAGRSFDPRVVKTCLEAGVFNRKDIK